MCTITFIPKSNQSFILTSNRDEAPGRDTFPPELYEENGLKFLYPKDAVAGGTWIGLSERKRVVCLMNGGFVAHERKSFYRKSRGVVVKEFLKAENLKSKIKNYDFNDIEPFTIVFIEWANNLSLYQLVWDGVEYHFSEEPLAPQIWSSSPLYPEALKKKREQWFSEFLFKNLSPSEEQLLQFHKIAGEGDLLSNLVMDRGFVKTKSITQIVKNDNSTTMRYEDLQLGKVSNSIFGN